MDKAAEEALADLCRQALAPELNALERRVEALEQSPSLAFSQAEAIATRRRVVKRAREAGLSVERISRSFGIATTTVWRDLDEVQPRVPPRTLGVDGRSYPSRHNGNGAGPATS